MVVHGLTDRKLAILKFGKTYKDQSLYRWVSRDYDSPQALPGEGPCFPMSRLWIPFLMPTEAVRGEHRHMSEQDIKLMIARDSSNLRFLKSWISSAGFPGYQRTGLFEKAAEGWVHSNSTIFFVLWHTRELSTELDTLAFQAVLAGDFRAGRLCRYYGFPGG